MEHIVHHPRHADHTHLAELYEREGPRLRAFVARLSGDPDAAEDLCHDAFLKALQGWSTRRLEGSTRAWLYQIARHTAYDYLRQRVHLRTLPLETAGAWVDARPATCAISLWLWRRCRHAHALCCCCLASATASRRSLR